MKFLLDSHTLLWALYEPHRLPAGVFAAVCDKVNVLYVSHVSILELTDKAAKFRLPSAGPSVDAFMERVLELGAEIVPIELGDIVVSVKLPPHHGDPLDRLLIAQARRLEATLLSRDGKFDFYDVTVFWK